MSQLLDDVQSRGDAARMERALDHDLVKSIPVSKEDTRTQELRPVTKERTVELTRAGGGETPDAKHKKHK